MNEPAKEIRAAQITMGLGLVDVSRIEHEGRSGILFRPRHEHIPIGEPGELHPGEYWPVEGDVVIWIENEAGAAVIQNYLTPFLSTESAPQRSFSLEWLAAARPPVHPDPMRGRQSFRSFDGAIEHMRRQAADAQFVSLTEYVETSLDRSADARTALTSKGCGDV